MRRMKGLVIFLITLQIVGFSKNTLFKDEGFQQVSAAQDTIKKISQFDDNYREMRGLNINEEIIAIPTIDSILFLNKTQKTLELEYQFPNYNFNRDIVIIDDIAFMTDDQELTILNVSDFQNITIISTYQQNGWKRNLEVNNGYVYYINDGEYIEILNATDLKNIQYLGSFQHSESVNSFTVDQNYIYGISSYEFFTLNITDKNTPEKMDTYESNPEEQFYSFVLRNDLVYINSAETIILNCSHPEDVLYYKTIILSRDTRRYLLGEGIAFSLEVNYTIPFQTEYFIQVYNLSDLDAISSITNFTSDIINWNEMEGWTLYGSEILWHSYYDLISFNISELANIKATKEFSCGQYSSDVLVEGSRAFVADNRGGCEIINIENITQPMKIYQSNHSYCAKLIKYQNYLFILSEYGQRLDIERITDDNELVKLGSYETYTTIVSMDLLFPYLYLGTGFGIKILYVGNPLTPIEIGDYFESMIHNDMKIDDDNIYTITNYLNHQFFRIFDASARSELSLISSFPITNITSCLEIKDGIAYIGIRGGVQILDISKPTNIKRLSAYIDREYRDTLSLHCTNNYLCIGSGEGVTVLDVSNKKLPVKVGNYYDGGYAYGIASQGNHIFVADWEDNLEILETTFVLNGPTKSKILVYILVPIGVVVILTPILLIARKIRKREN